MEEGINMKKIFVTAILGILLTQSVFAEQSMSKLEHVSTTSCDFAEIKRTIRKTADRVMFPDPTDSSAKKNLSVLDEGLGLTLADKANGATSDIEFVQTQFDKARYAKEVQSVQNLVIKAKFGKVAIVSPHTYNVGFKISDPVKGDRKGVIQTLITCRIEKDSEKSKAKDIKFSARLVSFEVK